MSAFKQTVEADLDRRAVSDILVTAFDRTYGGCNYWLNEFAAESEGSPERLLRVVVHEDGEREWSAVILHFARSAEPLTVFNRGRSLVHLGALGEQVTRTVAVAKEQLDWAWSEVMCRYGHTETARQLRQAMVTGDLDIDAEGADVLVQVALFGDIVYG